MIEGEEIYESASETGYRLCTSEQEIDNSIFSASWDRNDPRRMFICSQNGQLRVINTEDAAVLKYEVVFKRYTTYENTMNEPEKTINDHWDRMVTIPDRPNEIIFLLGMSKSLYYTALPGSDSSASTNASYPKDTSVVITAATRANFPGYLYGTPVMEISGHTGRIVSMAVSPAGHVLASGDELGNVRLLLLQLLDELSIIRKKEQRKRRHVVERQFNTFQKSYNTTQRVHDHSVFSVEWLPLIQTRNDVRYYGLVTGSQDSAVRIWTITCCSKKGITMTPCQSLNTMSAGVLCLTSYLLVDRQMEIVIARQLEGAKIQGQDDRHKDPFLPVKNHSSAREQYELNNAKSVYLAAGTDKGTIYVWKLHFHSIQKQLLVAAGVVVKDVPPMDVYSAESEDDEDEEEGTRMIQDPFSDTVITRVPKLRPETPRFTSFAIDDGTALHSLMQTSENPIIHVSVTSNGSQSVSKLEQLVSNRTVDTSRLSSSETILLAASDTNGVARLHTVDLTATNGTRNALDFSLKLSKIEQAMQISAENTISRIKSSLHRASAGSQLDRQIGSLGGMHSGDGSTSSSGLVNNNKPLVPASSTMQFPSAVVACAFQALPIPGVEEVKSANNSGTNTPMSAMSPSHTRFNATSNQSSPAGSVTSGRGYGLTYSMLSLSARTPSLAVVCAEGLIKLFASENMQTMLNGELGIHDPVVDNFATALSSTTASSPATSESSVPAPISNTHSRRSRASSAAGSVGNISTTSPNSKGSRGNVLFASPDASGLPVSTQGGNRQKEVREADSEIEARVGPIPRIQQQTVGGHKATGSPVPRNDNALSQSASASVKGSKVSSASRDVPLTKKSPVAPPVAPPVPPVLNVGGGVMFKTNVAHNTQPIPDQPQTAPVNTKSTKHTNMSTNRTEVEDDSLSFPYRGASTTASSSSRFKSIDSNTATVKIGAKTVTHRSIAQGEDDSSVEPRQPLMQTLQREPQTKTTIASKPSVTSPLPPPSSQTQAPVSGDGWTYERMSTQYQNDFAMAAFNTVKIQKQQLDRLQDDEVTVSTLQTTESDHRAAARATVRNQPLGGNRYSFLTCATSAGELNKNKGVQRLTKQTDPSYLARKQYGGPSEEDLKVLRPHDLLVDRELKFTPSTPLSSGMRRPPAAAVSSSSGKQSRNVWDSVDTGNGTAATAATSAAQNNNYRYNNEFGLYCEMDKTTLQPKFRMEVNADEILGRVDILRSMHLGRGAVERMREESMFSLMSVNFV